MNSFGKDLLSSQLAEEARQTHGWIKRHFVLDSPKNMAPASINIEEAANADAYWAKLKALGGAVDRETAIRLRNATDLTPDEVIALLAQQYSEQPENVEEIGELYGVASNMLKFEIFNRYLPNVYRDDSDLRRAFGRKRSAMAHAIPLRREHTAPAFRHSWEAWLLSPICNKRAFVQQRIFDALKTGNGNSQTAAVGLLWMQAIAESPTPTDWKNSCAQQLLYPIQSWGTPDQVLDWSLQWLSIAEKGGFAVSTDGDKKKDFHELLYTQLTWPGENKSEERYKVYVTAVRNYDISKRPPSQEQLLKRVLATYATYERKGSEGRGQL